MYIHMQINHLVLAFIHRAHSAVANKLPNRYIHLMGGMVLWTKDVNVNAVFLLGSDDEDPDPHQIG